MSLSLILRRTAPATQVLKFHDLAHAAHWHAPVHAHQFTKLHEHEHEMHDEMHLTCHADMPEPSEEEYMFHMADYDGSGTLSAEGLWALLWQTLSHS